MVQTWGSATYFPLVWPCIPFPNVCCIHGDAIAALVERHLPCFYTSLDRARVSPGRWVCSVSTSSMRSEDMDSRVRSEEQT
jgi:hypothetical protein